MFKRKPTRLLNRSMIPAVITTVVLIAVSLPNRDNLLRDVCIAERNKTALSCASDPYWLNKTRIAIITAIWGGYERTLKPIAPQTIPFDAFGFTDGATSLGPWIVDHRQWWLIAPGKDAFNCGLRNSYCNNNHTFNIAKYFKMQFHRIPTLRDYDLVLWLDGQIEVNDTNALDILCSELTIRHPETPVMATNHALRNGSVFSEAAASNWFYRYSSRRYMKQRQPVQPVLDQYKFYERKGYRGDWFPNAGKSGSKLGVWLTTFVLWDMKHPLAVPWLDMWFAENLGGSTQDQVSFPYIAWQLKTVPATMDTWPKFLHQPGHGR